MVRLSLLILLASFCAVSAAQEVPAANDLTGKLDPGSLNAQLFDVLRHSPDSEQIQSLIRAGAKVNAKNEEGLTPLMMAVMRGVEVAVVEALIDAGANVDATSFGYKQTALHIAAIYSENTETAQTLLNAGAQVDARDFGGVTPLSASLHSNNATEDLVRVLLKAGANADAKNIRGDSVIMDAMISDTSLVFLRMLKDAGADIMAKNDYGWTVLMKAAFYGNNDPELYRYLLDQGIDVNAKSRDGRLLNTDGETALHLAAAGTAKPEILRLLVDAGANVNALNEHGKTPLMTASESNYIPEKIRLLIECGAEVNTPDKDGNTALILASCVPHSSSREKVRMLLEAGADAKHPNTLGKRAIDYAKENRELVETTAYWKLVAASS